MYRCCIFDLDGTLINTIDALTYTTNLTLAKYGLGPVDELHVRQFVGDGFKKQMERALKYCGDLELVHYEDALKAYSENFRTNCLKGIKAYDGILDLLHFLKDRGIKIAVVSNKSHDRAVENVEAVFGKGFFDMVTGEQEGICCKPDPSGVLMTLRQLGINRVDCLYIGDTNTDMMTGKNAGIDTIGVTWGFRNKEELEELNPRYIAEHPADIKNMLGFNK